MLNLKLTLSLSFLFSYLCAILLLKALRELSDEICEQYGDLLCRFYNAYESIFKYVSDLNTFIDEVEEGIYIQQTLDTILLSEDGLQLMVSQYLNI